jgi:hypothetical protein
MKACRPETRPGTHKYDVTCPLYRIGCRNATLTCRAEGEREAPPGGESHYPPTEAHDGASEALRPARQAGRGGARLDALDGAK